MEYKILSIGNSFSTDTFQYIEKIAKSVNIDLKVYSLFIGGCSMNMHYENLVDDANEYELYTHEQEGFVCLEKLTIKEALKRHKYHYINIQQGSADGSRYTDFKSYEKIIDIINIIKSLINYECKFVFNMTWIGEETFNHPELITYDRNQLAMFEKLCEVMKNDMSKLKELECISYTGTAIQNARTANIGILTRDGYHLSLIVGRFIASLNYL